MWFSALRDASWFCLCAYSPFSFIIQKQSMKKFAVLGFEVAMFDNSKMNGFISLRSTKSQRNFRKSQKISNNYLKRSLRCSSFNLLVVESTSPAGPDRFSVMSGSLQAINTYLNSTKLLTGTKKQSPLVQSTML